MFEPVVSQLWDSLGSQIDAVFRTTVNSLSYVGNIIVFAVTVGATVTVTGGTKIPPSVP